MDKGIIELYGPPNDKYIKFFNQFSEIETLDVIQWKAPHLIAFFCKKYKEIYNKDFLFKFNSPSPSKCFEVFQIKRLANILTSQPNLLKEYIEWIFENKIVKAKKRITSISFLTREEFVNEYKFNVLMAADKKVDRTTLLPDKYITIFSTHSNLSPKTYGDLAFITQMDPLPPDVQQAMILISDLGFDKEILKKII